MRGWDGEPIPLLKNGVSLGKVSKAQLEARAAHRFGGGKVSKAQEALCTGTTATIRALLQSRTGVVTLDDIYTACLPKPFGREEKNRGAANLGQMKDVEREGRGLYKLKK